MCSMNSHTFYRQNIGTASYFDLWPVLFLIFDCRYSRYPTSLCDFSRNPIRLCYFFLDIKPTFEICSPISNLPLRCFPIYNSSILFSRYQAYIRDLFPDIQLAFAIFPDIQMADSIFLDIKPAFEIIFPKSNLPLRKSY